MKNKTVVLDANVLISGVAFGGKPLAILHRALDRDFRSATGPNILNEARRNLLEKLGLDRKLVDLVLGDFSAVSSVFVPAGDLKAIPHEGDDLVLEVALLAGADFIVTGDKKHLLPLRTFKGVVIEPPSRFLARFT